MAPKKGSGKQTWHDHRRNRDPTTGKFIPTDKSRQRIVSANVKGKIFEFDLVHAEKIMGAYPLREGGTRSGYPKHFKNHTKIVFTEKHSGPEAMFRVRKPDGGLRWERKFGTWTNDTRKYLEVPIIHTKNPPFENGELGVERHPIEKTTSEHPPGPFRLIMTSPNRDLAGIVYHPEQGKDDIMKKAHRDSSMSPKN